MSRDELYTLLVGAGIFLAAQVGVIVIINVIAVWLGY